MSTELSIKKNLKMNSDVNFIVTLSFGDENDTVYSPVINFKTPRAIRSMGALRTIDFSFIDGGESSLLEIMSGSTNYSFNKYSKTKSRGVPEIIFQLKTTEDSSRIIPNQSRVTISAPNGSPLKTLDDNGITSYLVTKKSRLVTGDPDSLTLIYLSITENEYNSISPDSQGNLISTYGNHSIRISSSTSKRRKITVSVGDTLASGLVIANNVHDILLVTFKQWDKSLNDKVKRYYFKDNDLDESIQSKVEVENSAPSYSFATQYFTENNQQRKIFTRNFSIAQGKNFAFYCTPVRYIKNNQGVWIPRPNKNAQDGWLQRNKNDKVMWGRAEYV